MRPLKDKKKIRRKSTQKKSNIFEKKSFFIEIWQLIFFSSTSILLLFTYINQAWRPINSSQLEITGLSGITKNDIEKVTSIFFPKNLLELNPKEIETYLTKKLPIKGIAVTRSFFPPGLHLNLL